MVATKCCKKCGQEKPASEFGKDKNQKDGLNSCCKLCCRNYAKSSYHHRKMLQKKLGRPIGVKDKRQGIDSMTQVDSVLREMSELQFKIDTEKSLCEKRVAMVKKYSNEIIEPELHHQHNLYMMLKSFLKRECKNGNKIEKSFRFGSIRFLENRLDIELNTALAGNLLNKP